MKKSWASEHPHQDPTMQPTTHNTMDIHIFMARVNQLPCHVIDIILEYLRKAYLEQGISEVSESRIQQSYDETYEVDQSENYYWYRDGIEHGKYGEYDEKDFAANWGYHGYQNEEEWNYCNQDYPDYN